MRAIAAAVLLTGFAGVVRGVAQEDRTLIVYVAASLADPVSELTTRWSELRGATVTLDLDATSRLAGRIDRGAPGDVLLSADPRWTAWLEP